MRMTSHFSCGGEGRGVVGGAMKEVRVVAISMHALMERSGRVGIAASCRNTFCVAAFLAMTPKQWH